MMSTVLLSTLPPAATDDLRRTLAAAGFAVADHPLGSVPAVDFGPVAAAVVEVGDRADVAAAQTRRWRIELGDEVVPVLWVLPVASAELAALGLEAGADAYLARPFDAAVFAAQVRALARSRAAAARVAVKAGEARLLGDQLRKAYAQLDGELEMARRVHRTFLPRDLPEVGAVRAAVCYRPRSRVGGDFYDVRRLDEDHVGFFLGDVMGRGTTTGSLLGVFVRQAVCLKEIAGTRYRLVPPDEVLTGVNRELIGLGLDDPPLVAMLAGLLNVRDGAVTVARAGLPPPVHVPAAGGAELWAVPGPFLGTADTGYEPLRGTLAPGDKLVLGSDGTRPDGDPTPAGGPDRLLDAAVRHRALSGQAFVDAVARDLLPHVRHPDDFTLLAVEMGV
jgi:serine phosphatase RsbU (regulator of sigma subunit)